MKTISDLIATRRDALKFGTFSLLGAFGETALWPHKFAPPANRTREARRVSASSSKPRARSATSTRSTSRRTRAHPKTSTFARSGTSFISQTASSPSCRRRWTRVAIVRTMKSHEVVHFRGQYYTRAGRPLNPAQVAGDPGRGLRSRV